jgi:nucleoside-diphosphate-sugar epimerase
MKTELLFLEGIDRDITFYIGRNQNENFNVINIGTGKSYSVKEVIGIIQAALGTNTKILSSNERRPGEVMDTQADILNAQKILGWLPVWTLEQGIAKMIETYKK